MNLHDLTRREFLRRGSMLSLAGAAAPWALNLATMAEASAAVAPVNDYKALVCVFLSGGNDHANTLIPFDAASHALYKQIRGDIGLPLSDLMATTLTPTVPLPGGRQMALAPGLAPLKPMFDAGQMAVLLNVGTLVQPTTVADFKARRVPLPPKLFSHNDQQSVWQSYSPEGAHTAPVLHRIATEKAIDMPIVAAVAGALDGSLSPGAVVDGMMRRPPKASPASRVPTGIPRLPVGGQAGAGLHPAWRYIPGTSQPRRDARRTNRFATSWLVTRSAFVSHVRSVCGKRVARQPSSTISVSGPE